MRLSDAGRTLLKGFEGLSLKAYPDTKKGYSIGYGHFGAKPGDVITREQADAYFDQDVARFENTVSLATLDPKQHEFDAMVSLAYNIGTGDQTKGGGFWGSTVRRLHNAGDKQGAADAFRMWNKSDGAVNPVLVERREKERAFYLGAAAPTGSYPPPPPQESSESWPPSIATAPGSPSPAAYTSASVASLATLALGWLVYRLINR